MLRLLSTVSFLLLSALPSMGELWTPPEFDDIVDSIPPARVDFVQNGDTLRMPYLCNLDIDQTHPGVSHLIYMVHGTLRNVEDYYQDIVTAASLTGYQDESLLFSPQYLTAADLDTFQLDESHLYWEYMGWRQGDRSDSTEVKPRPWRLSSYAAADSILLHLAERLPDLERIVVAGHSAGGQFANRYAAGSTAMDSLAGEGIEVNFVVTNPSTFLYFNEDRWVREGGWLFMPPDAETIAECPDWNDYKYGLENLNMYMNQDLQVLRDRYFDARVVLFSGADDIQFNDQFLDKSCPALLQGQMRLQRMQVYSRYLNHFFGPDIFQRHRVSIVKGVGHNHRQMYLSPCGLHFLFDSGSCEPLDPAMPWTELSPDIIQVSYANHAAWGDYDGDGLDDLYLTGTGPENRLIRNSGGFGFTDVSAWPLHDDGTGLGVSWIDYDGDADLDLYLVNRNEANTLFRNDGELGFAAATQPPLDLGENNRDAAWADYDGDGDLDLYLTRDDYLDNLLLKNEEGAFTDVTAPPLGGAGYSRHASWCDVDLDQDPDLLVCDLGGTSLYRNDGQGAFTDVSDSLPGDTYQGFSASWGDFDGDGDPDLFLACESGADLLLRNEGDFSFSDASALLPYTESVARSATWGDYDNDGLLDLYLADYHSDNRLLRNTGEAGFEFDSFPILDDPDPTVSVTWCDVDLDGDLDLYIGKTLRLNRLLRNELESGAHWLQVDLVGDAPNVFALGARVELRSASGVQSRQVGSDGGYLSVNSYCAEFGLGADAVVDTLRVYWPSGAVQESLLVDVDQRIVLHEGGGTSVDEPSTPVAPVLLAPYPNPFNPSTKIRFFLPESGRVTLRIYDLAGRQLRELMPSANYDAGEHQVNWDARDDDGDRLSSGVYFLHLQADGRKLSRKLVLLK